MLAASATVLAVFGLHCARHHNPLIDPALLRIRPFTGASVVTLLFSVSFGAMLLSVVLWLQDAWGWSALSAGLAIAPGPVMVPVISFAVTGRLIARFGPAPVIALGSTVFAGGIAWWAAAITLAPDYWHVLGGMLATGIGVGLTLPTLMSTAAASLPPHAFATGSGVVNMLRQVGFAVGVAVLVAVLGTPATAAGRLAAFQRGWLVIAAIALAGAIAAVLVRRQRPAPGAAQPAGAAPSSGAVLPAARPPLCRTVGSTPNRMKEPNRMKDLCRRLQIFRLGRRDGPQAAPMARSRASAGPAKAEASPA